MAKKQAIPNVLIEMKATNVWIGEANQSLIAPLLRHPDKGSSAIMNFSWHTVIALLNSSAPSSLNLSFRSPFGQAVNEGTV
jgi:hypothetical protein